MTAARNKVLSVVPWRGSTLCMTKHRQTYFGKFKLFLLNCVLSQVATADHLFPSHCWTRPCPIWCENLILMIHTFDLKQAFVQDASPDAASPIYFGLGKFKNSQARVPWVSCLRGGGGGVSRWHETSPVSKPPTFYNSIKCTKSNWKVTER